MKLISQYMNCEKDIFKNILRFHLSLIFLQEETDFSL